MGQRHRRDGPGVRHHVINRGIGKRLMFAGRRDRRQFLVQLAGATRREQLQGEAYSLMEVPETRCIIPSSTDSLSISSSS